MIVDAKAQDFISFTAPLLNNNVPQLAMALEGLSVAYSCKIELQ